MSNQKTRPAVAALMGISALAFAAFAIPSLPVHAAEKTMRIAVPFGPKSSVPDPRARQNGWLSNRAGVSETLIGLGYDMTMQPRLAETFQNLSPTEWKLTLRKDVKFHDGSDMTAQDVKASFEK
ncbi:MAG: ABC transporter substrate-binding protein, partial [Pseudomonadota bacterium]